MRKILIIFLLVVCFKGFTQSFNERKIKQINSFGINTNAYDLNDPKIHTDFSTILKLNRKRKSNTTFGIVLGCVSLLATSAGIFFLSIKKNDGLGDLLLNGFGGVYLAGGIIYGSLSIHLFNSSKKRKKQRDKLINRYKKME